VGSPERASEIQNSIRDPILSRIARRVYIGCGNCGNRVQCSNKVIDVVRAAQVLAYGELNNELEISKLSKVVAQVWFERYKGNQNVYRYPFYWLADQQLANDVSERLRTIERDELELAVENVLWDADLTLPIIIKRLIKLWCQCDNGKERRTVVDEMREKA